MGEGQWRERGVAEGVVPPPAARRWSSGRAAAAWRPPPGYSRARRVRRWTVCCPWGRWGPCRQHRCVLHGPACTLGPGAPSALGPGANTPVFSRPASITPWCRQHDHSSSAPSFNPPLGVRQSPLGVPPCLAMIDCRLLCHTLGAYFSLSKPPTLAAPCGVWPCRSPALQQRT